MEKRIKKITKSAHETQQFAQEYANKLLKGDVLALYGDLGSGKTTFVQGLAQELGITQRIISPTFIIMRSYDIPNKEEQFYHVDLYRTETKNAIDGLGLQELIEGKDNIIIIEWPEKLGTNLPKQTKKIYFSYISEQEREISYEQ